MGWIGSIVGLFGWLGVWRGMEDNWEWGMEERDKEGLGVLAWDGAGDLHAVSHPD
jgi:hypothetical protein